MRQRPLHPCDGWYATIDDAMAVDNVGFGVRGGVLRNSLLTNNAAGPVQSVRSAGSNFAGNVPF